MCSYPTLNFQTHYLKHTYFLFGLIIDLYAHFTTKTCNGSLSEEIRFETRDEVT